jgi:hypothetical protein
VFRILVESELFKHQLDSFAEYYPISVLDEALDAVTWALARRPEIRPVIAGTNGLRMIETLSYVRRGVKIPPLKIWYSILDENHVLLRAITRVDIEESADLEI